jgi:hypothetical protein
LRRFWYVAGTAVLLAGSLSALLAGAPAQAANPVPLPPQLVNHPFNSEKDASQLLAWGPGSNDPGNCPPNPGEIQGNSANITLFTTGASNDCTDLQSPHAYPTTDGYVYEADIYFSSAKNWGGFWMYGNDWPADGEIDALETNLETNYVSYHFADSSGQGVEYSTANGSLTADSPNITPGWHVVDISFGNGDISVWYDGKQYVNVPKNIAAPMWIVFSEGSCDQSGHYQQPNPAPNPPAGDTCATPNDIGTAGHVEVKWLRIFT